MRNTIVKSVKITRHFDDHLKKWFKKRKGENLNDTTKKLWAEKTNYKPKQ